MTESGDLAGRNALVIGVDSGMGGAIALALAEAGADVAVAAASLDGDEVMAARRVRRRIVALGRRSADYAFDVTLGQNVQVSTRQAAREIGDLSIVVYTVDRPLNGPIEGVTERAWAHTLEMNLGGAFFACRAAVREMKAHGGAIILAGGTADPDAEPGSAYAAARGGIAALARALAPQVAPLGIRVNAIVPPELAAITGADPDAAQGAPSMAGPLAVHLASVAGTAISGRVLAASA